MRRDDPEGYGGTCDTCANGTAVLGSRQCRECMKREVEDMSRMSELDIERDNAEVEQKHDGRSLRGAVEAYRYELQTSTPDQLRRSEVVHTLGELLEMCHG